jgi:hypothetical protein
MRNKKKRVIKDIIYIILIIFGVFSFVFLGWRLSGYAISQTLSTSSGVYVDPGIMVIYTLFSGSTTNFRSMSDSQLANITDMTLEKSFGNIIFKERVNLSNDAVNNVVDIDSNVKIYFRGMTISLTSLPSLNKLSQVTFKSVGLHSPYLYLDDLPCTETCNITSYSNNILVANVPGFSKLEVFESPYCGDLVCQSFNSENCANCPVDCGYCDLPPGSGGGTGGGTVDTSSGTGTSTPTSGGDIIGVLSETIPESFFSFEPGLIKVNLIQGESKRESFKIKNDGINKIVLKLSSILEGELISISEPNITLKKGETKEIFVDFFTKESKTPDIYIGKILVESAGKYKNFVFIIEVLAKNPLFDIIMRLNKKTVYPGESMKVMMDIENMGELRNIDIELYYGIKDFDKNVLYFRQESLAIDKKLSVTREIEVPEYIPEGDYVFYTKVNYGNISAVSSELLRIVPRENPLFRLDNRTIWFIVITIIILIIIYLIIKIKYRRV